MVFTSEPTELTRCSGIRATRNLPTDRMVISPWRPALGVLAGLGRSLGAGVVAAAASGDSSTSGHFFWLQREQQGPESEAGPCTVWRCWRCGQTCSMLGGPGDSLGRGRWLVCTSCRLWYSFSSSSSAAAFSFFSVIRRTKTPMVSSLVSSGRQAGLVPGGEREPPGFQGRSGWDPLLLAGYARTWQQRAPQAWVCAPRASALPQLLPPSLLSTTAPAAPGAERFQGPLNSTIPHTVYGMGASLSQGLPSPQPKGAVGGLSAQNPHQPQHTACHTLSLGLSLRPVFFVTNQGPRPQGHENGPNNQSWASSRVLGLAPRQQPAS